MIRAGRIFLLAVVGTALGACVQAPPPIATAPDLERETITANLMRDISVLASDEFGGRKPGTNGEDYTTAFIIAEMQAAGLVSGTNDPGSAWRAPVELLSSKSLESRITIRSTAGEFVLPKESATAITSSTRALVDGTDVVFVGSEAESVPADVISGQIVVMLGEPGVSPARRTVLFESVPAAIITVVEDDAAIAAVRRVYGQERLILARESTNQLSAYVTHAMLAAAFPDGTWADLVEQSGEDGFTPQTLKATIAIDARASRREFASSNVIGLLPGTVPDSGAVFLLGHWDHLGECGSDGGDDLICNGAVDNASGIAVMLELARRLSASGPYDRDIYFLATTAEEAGLLGAKAFVESPPVPLETIIAAFNFDTVAIAPAGSQVGFVGEGRTALDEVILEVVANSGRELGNREFAESFVRRQDGWALLEEGVPAVFLSTAFSSQIVLGPYLSNDYHRASDEIENIELGGAIDDLLLHEELIRRVASTALYTPPTE